MGHRPKCKMQNYKTPIGVLYIGVSPITQEKNLDNLGFGNELLVTTPKV